MAAKHTNANPASSPSGTVTATGTGTAQHLTTVGDAGHRFSTDAYPAFGGQDAAPSPLFYALGSLASCNQVTAALVAKDLGIRLGTWSFEVQGDLDGRCGHQSR